MANKLLYKTPYLSIYESEKQFWFAQRKNIDSIASLCFRKNSKTNETEFLILYQPLPETKYKKNWDDPYPCPITGSAEPNEDYLDTAIRETYEEGGILVNKTDLRNQTRCVATTQMNETVYCFLFDVTDKKQEVPKGDGTIFEKVSFFKWKTEKELIDILMCKTNDYVYLSTLSTCYFLYLNFEKIK